jgi:hypothetical protein
MTFDVKAGSATGSASRPQGRASVSRLAPTPQQKTAARPAAEVTSHRELVRGTRGRLARALASVAAVVALVKRGEVQDSE